MVERFTILSTLPQNLYAEGSPVLIAAGNLLKDNQTGRVLAQIKLQSLSDAVIKAATVAVRPLDTTGKPLGETITQEYLDLSVKCGEDFGQKTAVPLPNASTRGMAVSLTRVVFSNNKEWTMEEQTWEALPAPTDLDRKLKNPELVRQYKVTYGGRAQYFPMEHKDIWCCACGTWNRGTACHACRSVKEHLFSFDQDALTKAMEKRLAEEQEARERLAAEEAARQEQIRIEEEIAAKKRNKMLAIVLPIVAVCIVLGIVFTTVILPNLRYNAAVEIYNAGKYEEAIQLFDALSGYKDSNNYIINATIALSDDEQYEKAIEALLALNNNLNDDTLMLTIADTILAGYRDSYKGEKEFVYDSVYSIETDTIEFLQKNSFSLTHQTYYIDYKYYDNFINERSIQGTYKIVTCKDGVLELELLFDKSTYQDKDDYSEKIKTDYSGDQSANVKIRLMNSGKNLAVLWDDSGTGIHYWYYGWNN